MTSERGARIVATVVTSAGRVLPQANSACVAPSGRSCDDRTMHELNEAPDPSQGRPHRVVVVGGGFGGLQAALKLRRAPVEVTLVDRRNFHLFQPLTYQVATGALSPGEIAYPLRAIFKRHRNVRVLLAEVAGLRPRRARGAAAPGRRTSRRRPRSATTR